MLVMMVYTGVQQPLFRVALGRHAVPAGAPFVPDHAALQVPQTHAAGQGICGGEQSGLPHHKRVGAAQDERRQLQARRHVGARAGCQGLAAGDTKEGYHQHHCLGIQVRGSCEEKLRLVGGFGGLRVRAYPQRALIFRHVRILECVRGGG